MKHIQIGDMLKQYGYITQAQLEAGLKRQKEQETAKGLDEVLIEMGYLTEYQKLEALGRDLGLKRIDLSTYPIDILAVERIPKKLAVKYTVIAITADSSVLTVATSNPLNLYALEDIRLAMDLRVNPVLAKRKDIVKSIELYYSEVDAKRAAISANAGVVLSDHLLDSIMMGLDDDQAPIIRLLNSLLIRGYNTNASDIHIEPFEHETLIRMRRDGVLLPYMTLSPALHQGLVARIKILAQMDIAEKRRPQDGHFKLALEGVELNIRISFVPTIYGEKGMLRFLSMNVAIDHGSTFGMTEENYEKMRRMLKHPHGIIYLTGPTGSGKTTTLYSILQYMSMKPVNIATIEDPVERSMERLNQIQVNETTGVTFETGLRALLRQDPDIIMVGETRDYETASISARAAITGHLVFSTLHTNDAVSSMVRLHDMGLANFMVASSLAGVIAQRLVRKICPYCGEEYEADSLETELLFGGKNHPPHPLKLCRPVGCYLCNETGYKGRVAVHEILDVDVGLRKMISEGRMPDELSKYAINCLQMSTLKDEVRKLVLSGVTSVEEMMKITYSLD